MNRVLCTLLFLAIISISQCQSFKRISINQGSVYVGRHLETKEHKIALEIGEHATANVKILDKFLEANGLSADTPTKMQVYLTLPESGFTGAKQSEGKHIIPLECKGPCDTPFLRYHVSHPHFWTDYAYPIKGDETFISLVDGDSTVWTNKNRAVHMHDYTPRYHPHGGSPFAKDIYGFIGLAFQNYASKNFASEYPLFSVKLDSKGKGELIFGKDSTLIDPERHSSTWKTDSSWISDCDLLTVSGQALKEPIEVKEDTKNYFELNQVETTFQTKFYNAIVSSFKLTPNGTNEDGTPYAYYYDSTDAPISKLPSLVMRFEGESVTLPFEALFNKTKTPFKYDFIAVAKNFFYAYNDTMQPSFGNDRDVYTNIFGSYFLSHFYTVFAAPESKYKGSVSLYPTYTPYTDDKKPDPVDPVKPDPVDPVKPDPVDPVKPDPVKPDPVKPDPVKPTPEVTPSSGGSGRLIGGLLTVVALGAVGFFVYKKRAASKLNEELMNNRI